MQSTEYTYWLFYIKPDYLKKIPIYSPNQHNPSLFAYTDKKELAEGFSMIHSDDAFIMKKMKLDKDGVRTLALHYQNDIIKKMTLNTKDEDYNQIQIDICITEKEYMTSEGRSYAYVEDIWKYVWNPAWKFNDKFVKSLNDLGYSYLAMKLENGNSHYISNMEADIVGSFIICFKEILNMEFNR